MKRLKDPEICICAAIQLEGGGCILRGQRHCDCIAGLAPRGWYHCRFAQGFVTSRNRFVDRKEGMRLQLAAGVTSIALGGYRGSSLFSEDLY